MSQLDCCPNLEPSLDGAAHSVHIVLLAKWLCWIERTRFHAAKVRNASSVGNQVLLVENSRLCLNQTGKFFVFGFESLLRRRFNRVWIPKTPS